MKPITNLICLKTLYISSLFAFCFFIGSPAWAQAAQPPQSEFLTLVEQSRPMEMESTETQTRWNAGSVLIIGVGAYGGASAAGISWGIWSLASGDPANDIAGYASMAVGGIVGGLLGRSISNKIWGYDGDDDTRTAQFYVAPYLHEDASGLTFSSRF
jgi:hypothetical protein